MTINSDERYITIFRSICGAYRYRGRPSDDLISRHDIAEASTKYRTGWLGSLSLLNQRPGAIESCMCLGKGVVIGSVVILLL